MRLLNLHANEKYTKVVYVECETFMVWYSPLFISQRCTHTLAIISSCRTYTKPHLSPLRSRNENSFVWRGNTAWFSERDAWIPGGEWLGIGFSPVSCPLAALTNGSSWSVCSFVATRSITLPLRHTVESSGVPELPVENNINVIRHKEHRQCIKTNNIISAYVLHTGSAKKMYTHFNESCIISLL
jgi:hypothetical protein